MRRARLAAALIAGAAAACDWGPGVRIDEPVLPGREILALMKGNTFIARTAADNQIEIFFRDDGQVFMRGRRGDGVPFGDRGLWSVESDRLCTRWRQVRGGAKTCEWLTAERLSAGDVIRTFDPIGRLSAKGRVAAGNPERIDRLPAEPPRRRDKR